MAAVAAGAPAAWAADCPKTLGSSMSSFLAGRVSFQSTDSTQWNLSATGTTQLQPDSCHKDSVFLARPVGPSTAGVGAASRIGGGGSLPYRLQQAGTPWSDWGDTFSSPASTNGITVPRALGNGPPPAVQIRVAGTGAPEFPQAGTYSDLVPVHRHTLSEQGGLEPVIETLNAQVTIEVDFHCMLTWPGGRGLVLDYTSFGPAPPDATLTFNVRCNDTYKIGLANDAEAISTAMALDGTALGLGYTLTLSGNAQDNPPDLLQPATRTITARFNSAGEAGNVTPAPENTCQQASQLPGGCAQRSQINTHYVVISR
jgi:spore coat protein U-like protein